MRIILIGYGNVGKNFTKILSIKQMEIIKEYGLKPKIIAIIDKGGISTGKNSITIFTEINDLNKKIKELHDFNSFKAISYKEKIGMIQIINPIFIESPGWVAKIAEALASRNINIIEVTTSKAAINVFIDEDKIEEALGLIKKSLISN
jgi:aspartokinase